jgi:hypothetical protein
MKERVLGECVRYSMKERFLGQYVRFYITLVLFERKMFGTVCEALNNIGTV